MKLAVGETKINKRDFVHAAMSVSVSVLLSIAVLVGVKVWSFEEPRNLAFLIFYPLEAMLLIAFAIRSIRKTNRQKPLARFLELAISTFYLYAISCAISGLGLFLMAVGRWLVETDSKNPWAVSVLVAGSVVVAWTLFNIRLRWRSCYGLAECMFGVAVCLQNTLLSSETFNGTTIFAVCTAGVFLIVRGLDNIQQGMTKEPKDQLALHVLQRIRAKQTE